jgi:GH24 family phage-related lysozyme (muramidase)
MAQYKVLHYLDILTCNHGGMVELYTTVKERNTEIQSSLRIVTDDDLLHHISIGHCSLQCSKIVSIEQGLALDYVLKDDAIPILGNLSATTNKGCTVKWDSSLAAQLAMAEGRKKKMYVDTAGHPTVGIGFNLDKSGAQGLIEAQGLDYQQVYNGTQELNDTQIDNLFAGDTATAQASAQSSITNFSSLTTEQQNALTDATFNMGSFSGWPNFVSAMNAGNFSKAADQLALGSDGKSPSKWVNQVGSRAKRIIAQIRGDAVFATPQ